MSRSSFPHRTKKKQLSREYMVERDRFLALVQASADVFCFLTPAGEMQELSPSWYTFTGQEKHHWPGRGWLDVVQTADQPQVEAMLFQATTSGHPVECECHLRRYDGVYCLLHLRAIPVHKASKIIREIIVCGIESGRQEPGKQINKAQILGDNSTDLKASEERLTALLESISDAFVHVDAQWRYTYGNRKVLEYAGKERGSMLGQNMWDASPELLGTPIERSLRGAMMSQQPVHFEAWHPRWQCWLEIHAYPAWDGLSIYVQDITERKQAEEALRKSREEFRVLTETMPQLVWIARPDGFLEYGNQHVSHYLNAPPELFNGDQWLNFVHPDDRQTTWTTWQTAVLTGQPYEMEYRLREGRTGNYQWFLVRGMPFVDEQGHLLKWFGTSTNIDEKKRVEEALRESEIRFRHLVESNLIGIMVSDLGGNIREANDAYLALVDCTQEDLASGQVNWRTLTAPEYQEQADQVIEDLLTTGMFQAYEKEYVTKTGRRVPALVGGTLFHPHDSEPLHITFAVDLTARKEIERQKDLFLGMTSHELKTPLAVLKGALQLSQRRLKRVLSTEEYVSPEVHIFFDSLTKSLADAVRQVDVQTHLINDLLDISRIIANNLQLELEHNDLAIIVQETVEDLQIIAPERQILLTLPQFTAVPVCVDRSRINQVVTNYITNAIRYSSAEQPIQIGLAVQEDSARVWVKDMGPGLSEEAQQDIWQRYHQVKGAAVHGGSVKGLGLGLYICQMLIVQHQGEVGVISAPGEGCTFWFTLPLVK